MPHAHPRPPRNAPRDTPGEVPRGGPPDREPAPAKTYTLLDANREPYQRPTPGQLGGHRGSRIYGRLDCPAALRAIARGGYVRHRVFFADEATALAAGYRPCGVCLRPAPRGT